VPLLRRHRRPGFRGTIALALVAWASLALAADEPASSSEVPPPLPWQEPSPLERLFLQLPFERPEVVPERTFEAELRLLYSNSILKASDAAYSLFVHVETAQPTLILRYGLSQQVEAELGLPFFLDYGGFLDGPIDVVEGLFDAANPQRKGLARNVATFRLTRADGTGLVRDGPEAGLGDVFAGVKVELPEAIASSHLALRFAAKFPTGRLPFGSEEFDAGLGLLAAWNWRSTALRFEADALLPSKALPVVHIGTVPYGAVDLGLTERLSERVALQIQASGHTSPLRGTGLDQLDDGQIYVLVGTTVAVAHAVRLQAGVIENVLNPYRGADITFLLGAEYAGGM
jgi:hypothetical protein